MQTIITRHSASVFEVVTPVGRTLHVTYLGWGRVNVSVSQDGSFIVAGGRNFADLTEAVQAFRSRDIKIALRSLISSLIEE